MQMLIIASCLKKNAIFFAEKRHFFRRKNRRKSPQTVITTLTHNKISNFKMGLRFDRLPICPVIGECTIFMTQLIKPIVHGRNKVKKCFYSLMIKEKAKQILI
jgi:hypothetical protein